MLRQGKFKWLAAAGLCALSTALSPAMAQTASPEEIKALRAEVEQLKLEQGRRIAEVQAAAERIEALAATLDRIEGKPTTSASAVAQTPPAAVPAAAPAATPFVASRLQLGGDFRLRYESNFGDKDARARDRGVLRARLRASYKAADWLTLGGQIATGDPDDPNSTDITLSNFDDDLQISLDQAYARLDLGNLQIHGGKMPMPFVRTDLVWDGDVSPQGVSASYKHPFANGGSLKATGLYFLVDESVAGSNSDMIGGQLALDAPLSDALHLELAGAYYDYSLRSTAGGDAGDFRSNLIGPTGRYLSDFDLVDGVAALTYRGFDESWPVRLTGEYVKNLGAVTSADTGYGVDLLVGRAAKPGDWRFGYGYAAAETDAVLAAFSHDNTGIASNYLQHSVTFDYVLRPNIILNATFYRYRPKSSIDAGPNDPSDWLNRLRLNFLVNF